MPQLELVNTDFTIICDALSLAVFELRKKNNIDTAILYESLSYQLLEFKYLEDSANIFLIALKKPL
jgi:hypothetical protein